MKGLLYCNGGTKIYMIIVVLHSDKAISDLLWKFLSLPSEGRSLNIAASKESRIPYGVDRPEVQCAS